MTDEELQNQLFCHFSSTHIGPLETLGPSFIGAHQFGCGLLLLFDFSIPPQLHINMHLYGLGMDIRIFGSEFRVRFGSDIVGSGSFGS